MFSPTAEQIPIGLSTSLDLDLIKRELEPALLDRGYLRDST